MVRQTLNENVMLFLTLAGQALSAQLSCKSPFFQHGKLSSCQGAGRSSGQTQALLGSAQLGDHQAALAQVHMR